MHNINEYNLCINSLLANYLDIWKCISTLRGEGVVSVPEVASVGNASQQIGGTTTGQNTARYFKLTPTAHSSHVPWH